MPVFNWIGSTTEPICNKTARKIKLTIGAECCNTCGRKCSKVSNHCWHPSAASFIWSPCELPDLLWGLIMDRLRRVIGLGTNEGDGGCSGKSSGDSHTSNPDIVRRSSSNSFETIQILFIRNESIHTNNSEIFKDTSKAVYLAKT